MKTFLTALVFSLIQVLLGSNLTYAQMGTPSVSSSATAYTFQYTFTGTSSRHQIFIDVNGATSGFKIGTIGAEFLLENTTLYKFTGSSPTTWSWTSLGSVTFVQTSDLAKWSNVLKSKLNNPTGFVFVSKRNNPSMTSAAITFGSTPNPQPTPTPTPTPPVVVLTTVNPLISNLKFNNPDRGFFWPQSMTSSASSNASEYTNGRSLIWIGVSLEAYRATTTLPASFLAQYQAMFTNARTGGVKIVLRHSYTNNELVSDISQALMKSHLDQLLPIMSANADVIFNLQLGMFGAWGEGDSDPLTQTDYVRKGEILRKMIDALPASVDVSLRMPATMVGIYNLTGVGTAGAPASALSYLKRTGSHNDCFLASASDYGTSEFYNLSNPSDWRDFVGEQVRAFGTPNGGETCKVSSYSVCSNALTQMARQAFGHLNADYHQDVVQSWKTAGCYDEIDKRLGYRLRLKSISYPTTVAKSSNLNLNLSIENTGFSPVTSQRPVNVILFNATGLYALNLSVDPRQWIPGVHTIPAALSLVTVPAGIYNVALQMPDVFLNLQTNSKYSIQFANEGSWDNIKGWNVIKNGSSPIQITVTP